MGEEQQAGMQPQEEDSIDEIIGTDGQISNRLVREGSLFRTFRKIILLLPSSCHLNTRDSKALAQDHKIFLHCAPEVSPTAAACRCEGTCDCAHEHCSHDYHFRVEAVQRRPPIKLTVYYIYENEQEEPEKGGHNPLAKKIFVAFDFPMLLQSAMGPGAKWLKMRPGELRTWRPSRPPWPGSSTPTSTWSSGSGSPSTPTTRTEA